MSVLSLLREEDSHLDSFSLLLMVFVRVLGFKARLSTINRKNLYFNHCVVVFSFEMRDLNMIYMSFD